MADSGTDSDCFSSSATSSTCCSSDAGDSPRSASDGGAHPGQLAARPAPASRVPLLSLRVNLADLPRDGAGPEAPGTARQRGRASPPAAPRQQQQPAPSPRLLRLPQDAAAKQLARPAPQQPQASQGPQLLSLDILSPALTLARQPEREAAEWARGCAGRLGVPLERLKFFTLTEVPGRQLPPGCTRAAVAVEDSRFSLTALEELVAENERLAAACHARQQPSQAEPRQLEARLAQLQLENDALRAQLQQSEGLRRKGVHALLGLQQEFDMLSKELLACPMPGAAPHLERTPAPGQKLYTPVALADGLLSQTS